MRLKKSPVEYYLGRIRKYKQEITSLRRELDDICETCGGLKGITYDGVQVQTSKTASPIEDAIIEAERQIKRYSDRIKELMVEREKMISEIMEMKTNEYSTLLCLIFVEGKSPVQVWDKMGRSESWFWKNRRAALDEFKRTYQEELDKAGI